MSESSDPCIHGDYGLCDDCYETFKSQSADGINFFQGVIVALIVMCFLTVIAAQIYKYGQRHPDPQKFIPYASAVELANERELKGFGACEEMR